MLQIRKDNYIATKGYDGIIHVRYLNNNSPYDHNQSFKYDQKNYCDFISGLNNEFNAMEHRNINNNVSALKRLSRNSFILSVK